MILAHIGGLPPEETVAPVAGASAGRLLLARAWVMLHLRRRRDP
ncbi:MAG: hypothetical protein ABI611_22745 [Solirubrobacteraceae bacterium]